MLGRNLASCKNKHALVGNHSKSDQRSTPNKIDPSQIPFPTQTKKPSKLREYSSTELNFKNFLKMHVSEKGQKISRASRGKIFRSWLGRKNNFPTQDLKKKTL